MSPRTRIAVIAAVSALLVAAALIPVLKELHHRATMACTMIGSSSGLSIDVDAAVRRQLASLRVELQQQDQEREVAFSAASVRPDPQYVQKGVFVHEGRYRVSLRSNGDAGALSGHWVADKPARVTVEGITPDGRAAFRHTETFEFTVFYPNGKECDVTGYLMHRISLGPEDAVRL